MKITVNAFRRIKKIELTTKKITLIAGKIENGKTSLLQAIGIAITNMVIPIFELTQKQIIHLIHTGQPKATILLETESGLSGISYPTMEHAIEGNPPEISIYSAGLKHILDEKDSEIILKILKALPTKEIFIKEFNKLTNNMESILKVWETIEISGWNAAHQHATGKGRDLKKEWQGITGMNYGSKKALEWYPETWDFDLTNDNEENLAKVLEEEKEWLRIAEIHETINAIDNVNIDEAKKSIVKLKKEIEDTDNKIKTMRDSYTNTKKAISNMPIAEQPVIQKCPNCNMDLIIEDGVIKRSFLIDEKEIKKRKKDIEDLNKTLKQIEDEGSTLGKNHIELKSQLLTNEKIVQDGNGDTYKGIKTPKDSLDNCMKTKTRAEERLKAFVNKKKADKINKDIETNQKIIDILSPEGLRLTELNNKLEAVNKILADISDITGWGNINLDSKFKLTHRGWPEYLMSKSAKWRSRLAVQIALAKLNKDEYILMDEADILDSEGRNNLFKLLSQMPFNSIVAMTINKREDLLKVNEGLKKIDGIGYWVEDGRIV